MEIKALEPDKLTQFIDRVRKFETDSYETYLHGILLNVLSEMSEFIPTAGAMVLLDDPSQKRIRDKKEVDLVYISGFGPGFPQILGRRTSTTSGILGETYTLGRSIVRKEITHVDRLNFPHAIRELITCPIRVENSIVGVLLIHDKKDAVGFTIRDLKLIEIFGSYLSTSLQNAIDARKSKELSKRDDLTGLYNDRFFHRHLEQEVLRADESKEPLSLMFLDLDNFKSINDQHGHLVGSQTLREVGFILSEAVPDLKATLARYGGDEYVAILPNYEIERACEIAETIRKSIQSKLFMIDLGESDGSFVNFKGILSCSVGIASLQEHVLSMGTTKFRKNQLIRAADQAMYKAKEMGKNQYCVAQPLTGGASKTS